MSVEFLEISVSIKRNIQNIIMRQTFKQITTNSNSNQEYGTMKFMILQTFFFSGNFKLIFGILSFLNKKKAKYMTSK